MIHDADVVSGGYCQHTEGFGEMAEEENRWRVGQQISNIQFLPFLLSRSASPSYEARTRIPPAPPVAHLSRPVVADDDQPRRRPARVTRPSTHAMPKTGCGFDYFFFRRFVVFFAAFFAFLFFAIAALLA